MGNLKSVVKITILTILFLGMVVYITAKGWVKKYKNKDKVNG
jgi:hypothetical protein